MFLNLSWTSHLILTGRSHEKGVSLQVREINRNSNYNSKWNIHEKYDNYTNINHVTQ